MRELKLKYFIDLVSNLGAKAQQDAKAMQQAQALMSAAITGTNSKWTDYSRLSLLAGKNTALLQEAITGASNKFAALDRAITTAGRNTSLERQTSYLQTLGRMVDQVRSRANNMREALGRGLEKAPERLAELGAGGYAAGRVMAPPLRAYSSLEAAVQDLRVAMTDASGQVSKDFEKISEEAVKLGNQLPGTTKDFMMAARALIEQGTPTNVVANGGLRAASYFGALMGMDQYSSAETIAKVREAFGLKEDELVKMADLMQRGRYAFGINPQDYRMVASYAAPTYNTLGLTGVDNARRLLAIQGIAASVGLESSSFGTNFSMMLQRVGQIDSRVNKNSKEAREVRSLLGEHGVSMSFYDAKGNFSGVENMLQQLAKLRPLSPADQQKVLTRLFGVEAGRPAQILVQKGLESYRDALGKLDNQANLDQRIALKMETFASKLDALTGTIENAMAAIAKQTGELLKPAMDKANQMIGGPVQEFFQQNPAAGTAGLLAGGAGAAWSATRALTWARGLMMRGATGAAAPTAGAGAAGAGALGTLGVGLAGLFAGYQLYRLGDAFSQLNDVHNREGVTLSPYARARLAGDTASSRALGLPLTGGMPDVLMLTAPTGSPSPLLAGRSTELKIGEGTLDIRLHVTDERTTATTTVTKPLPLVRINPGNTNPAGYKP